MRTDHGLNVLNTYRYLRVAMPVLVVVLGVAVVYQIRAFECWSGSISAYYYTAARPVFVGCLCAIGTCLIVYRGNTDREDVALNVSGFLAFVVAFVPTTVDENCRASNVPLRDELEAAVRNNMTALLVGGLLTVLVAWVVRRRSAPTTADDPLATRPLAMTTTALVVGGGFVLAADGFVVDNGHYLAAVPMFVLIALVVWMNTSTYTDRVAGATSPTRRYDRAYRFVFAAMVVTVVVIAGRGLLMGKDVDDRWVWGEWVFWLETFLILEFAAFWAIQTWELRDVRDRSELAAQDGAADR